MTDISPSDIEGHPTLAELVEAVGEHFKTKVLPLVTDPRLRFDTLVALRALEVVNRQILRPTTHKLTVNALRQALFDRNDQDFIAAIEAGEFDSPERDAQLRAFFTADCQLGLSSWNPTFTPGPEPT